MRFSETFFASGFIIILAVCNVHLFSADTAASLCFENAAVMNGEWWRIITHPFVHVSWYHLLLDVAAVTILWREMSLPSPLRKLFVAWWCCAGSLITAAWFSPVIDQYGLCGLSGTAHGMMFFLGLHWITTSAKADKPKRIIGIAAGIILVGVSGLKSLIEVTTGQVIFTSIHAGDFGIPIVESHLGGIIGGLAAFLLLQTGTVRLIPADKMRSDAAAD